MSYLVSGNMCFQYALANKRGTVFGTKVGVEKYPCYDIDAAGARIRVYRNIQSEMVLAYWQIGNMIVEKQGGESRAKYGDGLIKELSVQLTKDFGKGFDERELRRMRQFYSTFLIWETVCPELSWSHYRLLIRVDDIAARVFYMNEAVVGAWSVRQLEREINTFSYQRYLMSISLHIETVVGLYRK